MGNNPSSLPPPIPTPSPTSKPPDSVKTNDNIKLTYFDRNGSPIDWSTVNASMLDGAKTFNIFGVDDIIDIVFMGRKGNFYSVDPSKFKQYYGDYSNNNVVSNDWLPSRDNNSDEPIPFHHLNRDEFRDLCLTGFNDGGGSYNRESDQANTSELMTQFDYFVGVKSDPNFRDRATEFFMLYNQVGIMTDAIRRGYKMFKPQNINHYQNWAGYNSSKSQYNYLIVFYLTLPNYLQLNAFLRKDAVPGNLKSFMDIPNNNVTTIVNNSCSVNFPPTTFFAPGNYYSGDVIYSIDTEYRCVVQPDGNLCVYHYTSNNAVWYTNTAIEYNYIFPEFRVTELGGIEIAGTRRGGTRKTILSNVGVRCFLHIDASNGILCMRTYDRPTMIKWMNFNVQGTIKYDASGLIKVYNSFKPDTVYKASEEKICYSPNMEFKLVFQQDGNLVLYKDNNGAVYWSSGTYGHPEATLAIQSDGNVVIYDNGNPIWEIGVHDLNKPVFMVADSSGYVVVYVHNDFKGSYDLVWSSAELFNIYFNLNSGFQTNTLSNLPASFSRSCVDAKYGGKNIDNKYLLDGQAYYCSQGLNMITDSRCKAFISEENDKTPQGMQSPYARFIRPSVEAICKPGYDKRFSYDENIQKKVNGLCSCLSPIGPAKAIVDKQQRHPICFDQQCLDYGYKSDNTIKARASCPSSICILDTEISNLQVAKNVSVSANCGKDGTVIDSSNNSANKTTVSVNGKIQVSASGKTDSLSPANPLLKYDIKTAFMPGEYGAVQNFSVKSINEKYILKFQDDGNLVLMEAETKNPIWTTKTSGNLSAILSISDNGTIHIYKDSNKDTSLWSVDLDGGNNIIMAPDNKGTVVIFRSSAKGLWEAVWNHTNNPDYEANDNILVTFPETKPVAQIRSSWNSTPISDNILIGIIVGAIILVLLIVVLIVKSKSGNIPRFPQMTNIYPQPPMFPQSPMYPPMYAPQATQLYAPQATQLYAPQATQLYAQQYASQVAPQVAPQATQQYTQQYASQVVPQATQQYTQQYASQVAPQVSYQR